MTASSPEKQSQPPASTPQQQPNLQRSNFSDWVGEDDDFYYIQDRPKERGGRKRKKKAQAEKTRTWDWDDIYDPTLPNNYAAYKGSDEQFREIRDWKARLYYHQMKEVRKQDKHGRSYSDEAEPREAQRTMNGMYTLVSGRSRDCTRYATDMANYSPGMFAPPSHTSFAPPSFAPPSFAPPSFAPPSFNDGAGRPPHDDDDDHYPPAIGNDQAQPPLPTPASVANDSTDEAAYQRGLGLSEALLTVPAPATLPPVAPDVAAHHPSLVPPSAPPTVPVVAVQTDADLERRRAEGQAKAAAIAAKFRNLSSKASPAAPPSTSPPISKQGSASTPGLEAGTGQITQPPTIIGHDSRREQTPSMPPPPPPPPEQPGTTISRAPVRYDVPTPPSQDTPIVPDVDMPEAASNDSTPARTNKPGQKGFAERLLIKYGWEKGQGLGATGSGITTALVGQTLKRKKLSDYEGGGWAQPANMGKIVGGKRRKGAATTDAETSEAEGKGKMSDVVKLRNMLTGLDVRAEIETGNLLQEIGEEMSKSYGVVERVFVWRRDLHDGADENAGPDDSVFVKFTSQLSALRAVNGLDGTEFAGNEVQAAFWDGERFERGEYA